MVFIKEIYLHVNKHIFVMFWEKIPDFCLLSKKWKTPKYLQNGHMHRKSNLKVFFRKDPPQLLLMYIFKTQNLKLSFYNWACFPT